MNEELIKSCQDYYNEQFADIAESLAITGSQAIGLATPKSDIDMILLVADSSPLRAKAGQFLCDSIEGKLSETLILDSCMIQDLTGYVSEENYGGLSGFDRLDFMERILSAKPIVGQNAWYTFRDQIDIAGYKRKLTRLRLHYASSSFDDLIGAKLDDDMLSMVQFFRDFISNELEALLCLKGDTNGRRKWLIKRLRLNDSISDDFKSKFYQYYFSADLEDSKAFEEWFAAALRFHQRLNSELLESILGDVKIHSTKNSISKSENFLISSDMIYVVPLDNQCFVKSSQGDIALDRITAKLLLEYRRPRSVGELAYATIATVEAGATNNAEEKFELAERVSALCEFGLLRQVSVDDAKNQSNKRQRRS